MQGIAAFVRRAGEKAHVTSRLEPGTWVLHGRRETASGKTASPETANLQRIPATPEQCVPVHKQSKRQSSAACAYIIDAEDRGRWRHTPAKTKAIAFWERAKFIPKERRIPAFSATVSPPLRPGSGYVHLAFTQLRCAGLSFLRRWFCTSDTSRGQVSATSRPDLGARITRRDAPPATVSLTETPHEPHCTICSGRHSHSTLGGVPEAMGATSLAKPTQSFFPLPCTAGTWAGQKASQCRTVSIKGFRISQLFSELLVQSSSELVKTSQRCPSEVAPVRSWCRGSSVTMAFSHRAGTAQAENAANASSNNGDV